VNHLAQIANIYYPKKKLLKKDDESIQYYFELHEKSVTFELKGQSPYLFLEKNDRNERILRKNFYTLIIENRVTSWWNKLFKPQKNIEITFNKKIIQCFSLINRNYLISTYDHELNHYLILLDTNLKIINEQQVGKYSWHSQNAISEFDGVIMYAEYNTSNDVTPVAIYRSVDYGHSWGNVFTLDAPAELRHWHTLQHDMYNVGYWLATAGDTPLQSRWFLSKDFGTTWEDITDKNFINNTYLSRNQSAHRTTAVDITDEYYYWSTDDLMGNVPSYFLGENGERKASSKLYRSEKSNPLKIEKLTNLGIHGRSMIRTDSGYIIITEAKYVTNNMQIFYVDADDMTKAYFLLSLYGTKRTGGTYSINSRMDKENKCYIKLSNRSTFLGKNFQTISLQIQNVMKDKSIKYKIEDYVVFEEHLWFLNHIKSVDQIHFSNNSVRINCNKNNNTFYMLLGDVTPRKLASRKLFALNRDKKSFFELEVESKKNTKIIFYIQTYNDEELLRTLSFSLNRGKNEILYNALDGEMYIKILLRFSRHLDDEIKLSNLKIVSNQEAK